MDYENDENPIEEECDCFTCKNHSRAFVARLIRNKETAGCHLVSIHNIAYQMRLMASIRQSILDDKFPEFVQDFMFKYYKERKNCILVDEESSNDPGKAMALNGYPVWINNALESVGITLK